MTKFSRRNFLKTTGLGTLGAVGAGVLTAGPRVHAAENNTIKVGLVGCGGRGSGAVIQALNTAGPTKLWALGDVFENRLNNALAGVEHHFAGVEGKNDCPKERQFIGFDAYKKVIDSLGAGGVVLLASPPAWRPLHVEYAAKNGVHIFMEKSFAVDGTGLKRLVAANDIAQSKNLKVLSGLYTRHYNKQQECIARIHDGMIGEVMTVFPYRVHGAIGCSPRFDGELELAYQIRNYSNFTWVNGSFYLDWLIHNLDVTNWIKQDRPVSVIGQGGRQVRTAPDQIFDHHFLEYSFSDGKRSVAQARHQDNTWGFFGVHVHGTKGLAVLGEGVAEPRIFSDHTMSRDKTIWEFTGIPNDGYQTEHDVLFDAIRHDKPCNETDYAIDATMSGIMGRMASESGQLITWEDAWDNPTELVPNIDDMNWDTTPPIVANDQGQYAIAMPGITKPM